MLFPGFKFCFLTWINLYRYTEVLNEKAKARHVAAVKEATARAKAERSAAILKFRTTAGLYKLQS
jgi:hypothetical protein